MICFCSVVSIGSGPEPVISGPETIVFGPEAAVSAPKAAVLQGEMAVSGFEKKPNIDKHENGFVWQAKAELMVALEEP